MIYYIAAIDPEIAALRVRTNKMRLKNAKKLFCTPFAKLSHEQINPMSRPDGCCPKQKWPKISEQESFLMVIRSI